MKRPALLCVLLIVFLLPPATAPAQDDISSLRAELEATRERLRVLREKILRLEEEITRQERLSADSVPADRFRELMERPGLAVPAPMLLTTLRLMGNGWDFAGEVDEVQLVSIQFP